MTALALPIITPALPPVATTPEIDQLLQTDCAVAIGVSGGKDSTATAFATVEHLDRVGHTGPRVLIHSDLGVSEWPQSIEWCHMLADRLGLELIVTRREKGDMMDRWEQRWSDNVARYAALSCVQLILPWSTPGMRFCTSELKVSPICRALIGRFPGRVILSVTGIRRQESSGRAKAPIASPQPKLASSTRRTTGIDWHPIADWTLDDVWNLHAARGFPPHPAYTLYGLSRVSCRECIMQNDADAKAAAAAPVEHRSHRRIGLLEIKSTFAFQSDRWRADLAPFLFSEAERQQLGRAKAAVEIRESAEAQIPKDLLYTKGWPNRVPTLAEAELLASVRRTVAGAVGLSIDFTEPTAVIARYEELMAAKVGRGLK